jgi:Prokaryotic phospholipase A2
MIARRPVRLDLGNGRRHVEKGTGTLQVRQRAKGKRVHKTDRDRLRSASTGRPCSRKTRRSCPRGAAGLVSALVLTLLGLSMPSAYADAPIYPVTNTSEYLTAPAIATQSPFDALRTTDELLFRSSMMTFLQAKNENRNGDQLDWSTDDCSNPLIGEPSRSQPAGYDFRASCWRHDFGYRNYKRQGRFDETVRPSIDDNFHRDMYDVCSQYTGWSGWRGIVCRRIADAYYEVVRTCGYDNGSPSCADRARYLGNLATWS